MDCGKKIDYRAKDETVFCVMNLLLSQNPKIPDSVREKRGHYLTIQIKNDELS